MKLWKISQDVNIGYDTYDSAVVAAETMEEAKTIHPNGHGEPLKVREYSTWVGTAEEVDCEYLGEAKEGTITEVICASFNAG